MNCIKISALESLLYLRVWMKLHYISFWIKFGTRDIHINLLSCHEFRENWSSENIVLQVWMNLFLCFQHFLSDFGDILFLSVLHIMMLEKFYEFHENQCNEVCTFFCGHNWNYIYMCAVKQYYVLDVKNTLVKSFILCHRVHHLQCCALTEEYHRDILIYISNKMQRYTVYWHVYVLGDVRSVSPCKP